MAKDKHKVWQKNIKIDTEDNEFLNTKHWFVPDDFVHDLPQDFMEMMCDYLNRLRIEYIALKWNGQPKKSYKPEVAEKINRNKDNTLKKKSKKAQIVLDYLGISLREDFDPFDENSKPKFGE